MKKYLIPALAVAAFGMAPGAFAHDARVQVGVGVSASHRHYQPDHRSHPVRGHERFDRDFDRHDHDRHHRFDRHDHGRRHGWHRHRNGRYYRNCR